MMTSIRRRRTSKETLKSLRSLSVEHLLNVTNFNSLNYGLDGYLLTTRPRDSKNVAVAAAVAVLLLLQYYCCSCYILVSAILSLTPFHPSSLSSLSPLPPFFQVRYVFPAAPSCWAETQVTRRAALKVRCLLHPLRSWDSVSSLRRTLSPTQMSRPFFVLILTKEPPPCPCPCPRPLLLP